MIYDCIIVGKGPAGITAAIYLKRYGYEPLILAKDGGALERVKDIENYYGIPHITGPELLKVGEEQAKSFGIEMKSEEVLELSKELHFVVTTNEQVYEAKSVILACGASRNRYAKADQYEGVSYCATCDGFFYRKKKIALIGNGKYMAHELSVLENISKDILVFTDGLPLETELTSSIPVITAPIDKIHGNTHITGIEAGGKVYPIDGCFVAIGNASGFTLAKHLGIGLQGNSISVDEAKMTNIEGLFSCGDSIGGLLQISKAVGDGAICATSVSAYLKKHKF
ncbi:MAG: NAD(P)/FAD-dependent oxidoreductase [Anaeroplasmataceae bacterium]|nr:NAD(P)/FAD-dependent oxidoreductase [Anaeroplasmataceae bacterium]